MGTCAGGPSTIVIQAGPNQPIIAANTSVKNLIVNAGATLTINPGITLFVCGDFTINGNISCGNGSTIQFIGNANQTVSGNLTGGNALWHCTMAKFAGTVTLANNLDVRGNLTLNAGGTWVAQCQHIRLGGDFVNNNGNLARIRHEFLLRIRRQRQPELHQPGQLARTRLRDHEPGRRVAHPRRRRLQRPEHRRGRLCSRCEPDQRHPGADAGQAIATGARQVYVRRANVAACTAGNNTSYVEGNLRRAWATGLQSWDFPVGISTKGYQRAQVIFTVGPVTAYDLTAFFTGWVPPFGPVANECVINTYDVLNAFDNGYWTFNASVGTGSGTYTMRLFNNNVGNNFGSGWTVMKSAAPPAAWSLQGTCFIPSTAADTRRTGMTNDSTYATAQSQDPLPIELLSFTVEPDAVGNLCRWATASETNNDYFDLERSLDGDVFKSIQRVEGYGIGSTTEIGITASLTVKSARASCTTDSSRSTSTATSAIRM